MRPYFTILKVPGCWLHAAAEVFAAFFAETVDERTQIVFKAREECPVCLRGRFLWTAADGDATLASPWTKQQPLPSADPLNRPVPSGSCGSTGPSGTSA